MVTFSLSKSAPKSATVVDVPMTTEEVAALPAARKTQLSNAGFEGKVGQTLAIVADGTRTEVLVGLGAENKISTKSLRSSAAAFVRSTKKHSVLASTLLSHTLPMEPTEALPAVVQGLALPLYRFDTYKTEKKGKQKRIVLVASGPGLRAALSKASAIVDAVAVARDFGNEPGGSLTPDVFAKRAKKLAADPSLTTTVWTEKRIEREKLGGILAVNQGSEHPPRLLKIEYKPKGKASAKVALVGKGITFDSGGLSLKSNAGMMTMKIDMAGGAAVLATMLALPAVKSKVAVTAYVPLTDNMTGGNAQRPGDVFTARNGKTVEVLNTDAEGRLVLADALSLAAEAKPDAIIDIATLTGASTMALGKSYAALLGSSNELCGRLIEASKATSEKVWRLPLPSEYRKKLDSPVADLKNIGSDRFAGASIAGLFLENFTDGLPWAHIDLGMSALTESDKGTDVKGATGFGVRLLIELLENWE